MCRTLVRCCVCCVQLRKMHIKPAGKLDAEKGFAVTAVLPEDTPAEKQSPLFPYDLQYTPPSLIMCVLWKSLK